jgi:4,5-dihydroxyphthalate decarboxylase
LISISDPNALIQTRPHSRVLSRWFTNMTKQSSQTLNPTPAASLTLSAALRSYGFTVPVKDGRVPVAGVNFDFVDVQPQIAAYRRMVRGLEFDLCEMAPTTYIIARGHGVRMVALPVFFGRRFHHSGLVVRPDAGITVPSDLEGKRVGVRAYSVTTGVWMRGILQNEYGVDLSKVTWVVDDEEHVRELILPPNVEHVPAGKSLASMIEAGEIDAGFTANAGIGRVGKPTEGWTAASPLASTDLHELIPDAKTAEAAWFARTGILPAHGVLCLREDLVVEHPWLARALYDAFTTAKAMYLEKLDAGHVEDKADQDALKLRALVGPDHIPYGLAQNRSTIEALSLYAFQQGLIPRLMTPEELFIDMGD